jgi:hypothetical protein
VVPHGKGAPQAVVDIEQTMPTVNLASCIGSVKAISGSARAYSGHNARMNMKPTAPMSIHAMNPATLPTSCATWSLTIDKLTTATLVVLD